MVAKGFSSYINFFKALLNSLSPPPKLRSVRGVGFCAFANSKSDDFIKDAAQRPEAADERDQYIASNVFWLPPEARWHTINAKAKSPEIGKVIDDAMGAIERENPTLKGVLPRDYARLSLDKVRLGGLVDIISNIGFNQSAAKSKDVLGRVYEYFLGKFASAEGKGGGEFYTDRKSVV